MNARDFKRLQGAERKLGEAHKVLHELKLAYPTLDTAANAVWVAHDFTLDAVVGNQSI